LPLIVPRIIMRKPRFSYQVYMFNGTMHRYKTKNYRVLKVDRRAGTIKMTNGIGSFISYLTPRQAKEVAVKGMKIYVKMQKEKLKKIKEIKV
jgi:hypothetical protein